MSIFFQHLRDPEYMHVLLNPLPVYGLSIAVIALALAVLFRNRTAILVALIVIIISGMSAWPVLSYGQAAYDRIKSMSDPAGEQWLDEHMARGEQLIYAFYLLAALGAAGILLPYKWPRSGMPLALATLILGGATLGIGGYISYAGGHIRHKEFRFEPPPPPRMSDHKPGSDSGAMDHGEPPKTPAESEQAKPMDHGSMPGMSSSQSPESKEQPTPHDAAMSPAPPTQEQLEASRLQLEASRLQLEASRKQLEAAEAAKKQAASPSPSQAQPSPTPKHH